MIFFSLVAISMAKYKHIYGSDSREGIKSTYDLRLYDTNLTSSKSCTIAMQRHTSHK